MIVTNSLSNITVPFFSWVMVLPIYSGLQIFRFSPPGEGNCIFIQNWAVFLLVCTSPFLPGYLFEIVLVPFTFNGSNPSPFCRAHEQRTFLCVWLGMISHRENMVRFSFSLNCFGYWICKSYLPLSSHITSMCCNEWHSPFPITQ